MTYTLRTNAGHHVYRAAPFFPFAACGTCWGCGVSKADKRMAGRVSLLQRLVGGDGHMGYLIWARGARMGNCFRRHLYCIYCGNRQAGRLIGRAAMFARAGKDEGAQKHAQHQEAPTGWVRPGARRRRAGVSLREQTKKKYEMRYLGRTDLTDFGSCASGKGCASSDPSFACSSICVVPERHSPSSSTMTWAVVALYIVLYRTVL